MDWRERPETVILREQCRVTYQTAWRAELERRKRANAARPRGWEIKPEDYTAADEAGFDAMWRELMRQKDFICAN